MTRRTLADRRLTASRTLAHRRRFAIALRGPACQDCGLESPDHPEVFEFDHVRGEKRANVSQLLLHKMSVLLRELRKCDLVCRNCHAIRTKRRRVNKGR